MSSTQIRGNSVCIYNFIIDNQLDCRPLPSLLALSLMLYIAVPIISDAKSVIQFMLNSRLTRLTLNFCRLLAPDSIPSLKQSLSSDPNNIGIVRQFIHPKNLSALFSLFSESAMSTSAKISVYDQLAEKCMFKQLDEINMMVNMCLHLGHCHRSEGKWTEAAEKYQQALALIRLFQFSDDLRVIGLHQMIGTAYSQGKQFQKAIQSFLEAENLLASERTNEAPILFAQINSRIGYCLTQKNDIVGAKKYIDKSLRYWQQVKITEPPQPIYQLTITLDCQITLKLQGKEEACAKAKNYLESFKNKLLLQRVWLLNFLVENGERQFKGELRELLVLAKQGNEGWWGMLKVMGISEELVKQLME